MKVSNDTLWNFCDSDWPSPEKNWATETKGPEKIRPFLISTFYKRKSFMEGFLSAWHFEKTIWIIWTKTKVSTSQWNYVINWAFRQTAYLLQMENLKYVGIVWECASDKNTFKLSPQRRSYESKQTLLKGNPYGRKNSLVFISSWKLFFSS